MTTMTTTATMADQSNVAAPKDDVAQIFAKLSSLPIGTQHPALLSQCRPIIQLWHDTFSLSDPPLWNRLRRALPKELNESAFIIDEMIKFFDVNVAECESPYTIVDMCSGVGFLNMFLSHLLPDEKCSRIWAIDTLFGLSDRALAGVVDASVDNGQNDDNNVEKDGKNTSAANRIHLTSDHLTSAIHPIPIKPRKANIKKGRELKQIAKHCIDKAPGPTIILGVHLCKSLSVHTVRLFNASPRACRLYLKPCCLPGRKELRRREPPFWTFPHMDGGGLGVVTLYCGEIRPKADNDGDEKGEEGGGDSDKNTEQSVNEVIDVDRELKRMGREAAKQEGKGGNVSEGDQHQQHHHNPSGLKGGQLFKRWTDLLCDAVDTSQEGVTAEVHHCSVQQKHFQNDYIVAARHVV